MVLLHKDLSYERINHVANTYMYVLPRSPELAPNTGLDQYAYSFQTLDTYWK